MRSILFHSFEGGASLWYMRNDTKFSVARTFRGVIAYSSTAVSAGFSVHYVPRPMTPYSILTTHTL